MATSANCSFGGDDEDFLPPMSSGNPRAHSLPPGHGNGEIIGTESENREHEIDAEKKEGDATRKRRWPSPDRWGVEQHLDSVISAKSFESILGPNPQIPCASSCQPRPGHSSQRRHIIMWQDAVSVLLDRHTYLHPPLRYYVEEMVTESTLKDGENREGKVSLPQQRPPHRSRWAAPRTCSHHPRFSCADRLSQAL